MIYFQNYVANYRNRKYFHRKQKNLPSLAKFSAMTQKQVLHVATCKRKHRL